MNSLFRFSAPDDVYGVRFAKTRLLCQPSTLKRLPATKGRPSNQLRRRRKHEPHRPNRPPQFQTSRSPREKHLSKTMLLKRNPSKNRTAKHSLRKPARNQQPTSRNLPLKHPGRLRNQSKRQNRVRKSPKPRKPKGLRRPARCSLKNRNPTRRKQKRPRPKPR